MSTISIRPSSGPSGMLMPNASKTRCGRSDAWRDRSDAGDQRFGTLACPGAGMMPKLVCALMMMFGAILLARGGASAPFSDISWNDLPHAVRVLAITAAAVALYTTLGFVVTMSLMLFALIAFEGRNLLAAAVYSVGVSLLTYGLFTLVLKSPLEQGILGF